MTLSGSLLILQQTSHERIHHLRNVGLRHLGETLTSSPLPFDGILLMYFVYSFF